MKTYLNFFTLITLLLCISPRSSACDCLMKPVTVNADESKYVLIVHVTKTEDEAEGYYKGSKATVSVSEVLKGDVKKGEVLAFEDKDLSNCTFLFEAGKSYLLFAYRQGDKFTVYRCTHSDELMNSKKKLKAIRRHLRRSV